MDENIHLRCIICGESSGNIKALTPSAWDSMRKAANKRSNALKSDKFKAATTKINNKQELVLTDGYHTICNKNYTAVKRSIEEVESNESMPQVSTRGKGNTVQMNKNGLLEKTCIFCQKIKIKKKRNVENLSKCLTTDGSKVIQQAAEIKEDIRIMALLGTGGDLVSKEAFYHKTCRREYTRIIDERDKTENACSNRKLHAEVLHIISLFVQENILDQKQAIKATTLFEIYKVEFINLGGSLEDINRYTVFSMTSKLKELFEDKLKMSQINSRQGNILHCSSISRNEALNSLYEDPEIAELNNVIRTLALKLRRIILNMPKYESLDETSIHSLKDASPQIPKQLDLFYRTLFLGLNGREELTTSDSIERKIFSCSSDAIYITSRGSIRPWKHTLLGLTIGSLTGSKTVLQMLNRLGHLISYDEVKVLETAFAVTSQSKNSESPDGICREADLATALAWDNYDANIETLDGKDTFHGTFGICYQNKTTHITEPSASSSTPCSKKKLKKFEGMEKPITPYRSSIKKASFSVSVKDDPEVKDIIKLRKDVDIYWLMKLTTKPMPLFFGYYSKFCEDILPVTNICYMDPISLPPTRLDVVKETLVRTLKVFEETSQNIGVVSYDLAIAVKAYSIQALESPTFDKIFIMLGNFHLELAFFGAIGTYIAESGIEVILTESGVLAEGSLNGFIRGKFYNRCTRVHEILAASLEKILFDNFIQTLDEEEKEMLLSLLENDVEDQDLVLHLNSEQQIRKIFDLYDKYFLDIMHGKFGKTAAYWSTYIFLINRVHRELQRAVKSNNVDLYITVLPIVIDVFFSLNRPNYARWGTLFLSKLRNLPHEFRQILEKGAFSIRRTPKHFSRNAIDLTLEQTVNRDSASASKGIVAFRNSESTFRRWCISTSQRGLAVSEMRSILGLDSSEQPAAQLQNWRVKRDNQDIENLTKVIKDSCNPFDNPMNNLVNLSSGKFANEETSTYLLNVLTIGHDKRKKFENECEGNSNRLLETVPRTKVLNFASENCKRSGNSTISLKCERVRDIFGRILLTASESNEIVDLKHILSYPITHLPLSLSHEDGIPLKTDKSSLMKGLESFQKTAMSDNMVPPISSTIIDGGLLLYTYLPYMSGNYGNMARELLIKVCSYAGQQIHVCLDKYEHFSIKEGERRLRGGSDAEFHISGPSQIPHQKVSQLLKNADFKNSFSKFILSQWTQEHFRVILGSKTVFVSYGGKCIRIERNNINEPENMQAKHEEADTLIALHVINSYGNTVVRSSDTDVMIILIGMLNKRSIIDRLIILDVGYGNNRRFINLSEICNELKTINKKLPTALIALHAFTGCDFTAAFFRKGKMKALQLLKNESLFIEAFASLCTAVEPERDALSTFVCRLYGEKCCDNVNSARYKIFKKMSGASKDSNPFSNIKKIDCSLLPPCLTTLNKKIDRTHYVSQLWFRSDCKQPSEGLDPLQYGWKLDANILVPDWFDGAATPSFITSNNSDFSSEDEKEDSDWSDEEMD